MRTIFLHSWKGGVKKCAIITGIYGQDGSLLAEYLLAKNYRVIGLVPKLRFGFAGLNSAEIFETDISDPLKMQKVFLDAQPDECYHLAATHHSSEKKTDTDIRTQMLRVNFLSTQAILDAILQNAPHCRFLYAGSSQMYTPELDITVVDESTPYRPSSYYGVIKGASAQLIDLLRRERGLWGVTAILFNHESVRRSEQFLSRKVTSAVAEIVRQKNRKLCQESKLHIRDISARTDWSAATDFVNAFHLSLQAEAPADYVLASGKVHSVRELLQSAFQVADLDWRDFVLIEQSTTGTPRPCLQGDPQKARTMLGWEPQKSFSVLIQEMVKNDLHSSVR